MRIIINSDILYTGRLEKLPEHLAQLAQECAKFERIIVLPTTTVLEIQRRHTEIMNKAIRRLEQAYDTLREAGVKFEEQNAADLFQLPDLAQLFRDCGAKVEVVEPTYEDLLEAHRRACLHLPPHPPDIQSDEMRDLVIWTIALRLSKADGGAIIVSRDKLHSHITGDVEASTAQLERVTSVDELLNMLGVQSPTGALVSSLLKPIWVDLRAAELPLPEAFNLRKVTSAVFKRGNAGLQQAEFDIVANSENGGILATHIDIEIVDDKIVKVRLRDIVLDGAAWRGGELKILTNRPAPSYLTPSEERLDELRKTLGEIV